MVAPPIMKKPNEKVLFRYYEEVNNSINDNSINIQDVILVVNLILSN